MRVALFTDTFPPNVNGVAKTLERWVRYLQARGAEVKVFAPQNERTDLCDSISVERFYSIPFALYPECRFTIPNPLHIRSQFKRFRPTIVHVATPFNLGLLGVHQAKKQKVPTVASYHTNFDQYLQFYKIQWVEPVYWRYMQWLHQSCRKVYVPSQTTLNYVSAKGLKNLEIWSRGVDTERFRPYVDKREALSPYGIDPNKFIVLYVGRIAAEKNIDVLLNVFDSLPAFVRDNSHFIIAGDGPLFAALSEQYKRDNITFPGYVQGRALADLYAAADVFLFPSAHETFGNVVLEAMASGTPVIGARSGGVQDIVRDGMTGLLCEPGDVGGYVEAVEQMYVSEELRRGLGLHAREYSLRQSWDAILGRLYQSYEEVQGSASVLAQRQTQNTG